MMKKIKALAAAVAQALASKQARGPELALARLVLGALTVKLGFDFSKFVS